MLLSRKWQLVVHSRCFYPKGEGRGPVPLAGNSSLYNTNHPHPGFQRTGSAYTSNYPLRACSSKLPLSATWQSAFCWLARLGSGDAAN